MTQTYTVPVLTLKAAQTLGKVSKANSKMPGTSFATDPFECKTGSKLAKIPGTPCHKCYARKLANLRPSVKQGYAANLAKGRDDNWSQSWVDSMAFQIQRQADKSGTYYHRWFDSGDLDSLDQLVAIVAVAVRTPKIRHWLPTQERAILAEYLQDSKLPENLTVRLSASKTDMGAPRAAEKLGVASSTTHKDRPATGFSCPARTQGNQCRDCRACWDSTVANVSYPLH